MERREGGECGRTRETGNMVKSTTVRNVHSIVRSVYAHDI